MTIEIGSVAEPEGVEPVVLAVAPLVAQPLRHAVVGRPERAPDRQQFVPTACFSQPDDLLDDVPQLGSPGHTTKTPYSIASCDGSPFSSSDRSEAVPVPTHLPTSPFGQGDSQ